MLFQHALLYHHKPACHKHRRQTMSCKIKPLLFLALLSLCHVILLTSRCSLASSVGANIASTVYDQPVLEQVQANIGEQKCQPLNTPFCNIDSYLTVQPFNNTLGHTSLNTAIAELHKFAYLFKREPCKSKIQLFLCSLYAPVCVTSTILDRLLLPCRDDCEEARQVCSPDLAMIKLSWPEEWDCRKFNYHQDDKLCVINNARENPTSAHVRAGLASATNQPASVQPSISVDSTGLEKSDELAHSATVDSRTASVPFASVPSSTDTPSVHENETICADDLFDCKLRDPQKNMNALCIDPSWVCDGKKDCVINGMDGDGLDEVGCEKKCLEGQHICDGKCINRADICNGKVDCSQGTDELDCYDYITGLIQSILCIFALFSAIFLLVRFFRIVDTKADDPNGSTDSMNKSRPISRTDDSQIQEHDEDEHNVLEVEHSHTGVCIPDQTIVESIGRKEIVQIYDHNQPSHRYPIYHEPAYSVLSRSDYERLNIGGYSGASSVYAAYGAHYLPHCMMEEPSASQRPEPVAPPPTPLFDNIYSNISIAKSMDLYMDKYDMQKGSGDLME